ncbi:hypothetical protein [Paenibacillus sp. A3]|uniref:hypothetical protein n=1 Tax=Paenibacillus sp. A3 TaxID=1337054 RepID=UPI001ED98A9C|nr:hypothetical protein [Paenibacillus sp. A3]
MVLGVVSATTGDSGVLSACYTVMHLLSTSSLRASTIGTVVTGVLLSVLMSWGLFRYYWIIAKEALTLLCILLGAVGMYFWTLRAVTLIPASGMDVWQRPDFVVNNGSCGSASCCKFCLLPRWSFCRFGSRGGGANKSDGVL